MEQGDAETCLVVVLRNGEIKGSFFLLVKWAANVEHSDLSRYDVGRDTLALHGVEKSKRRSLSSRPHGAPRNVHTKSPQRPTDVGTPQICKLGRLGNPFFSIFFG
jgi:hypothetical protein